MPTSTPQKRNKGTKGPVVDIEVRGFPEIQHKKVSPNTPVVTDTNPGSFLQNDNILPIKT
jgi:hypothetical protein